MKYGFVYVHSSHLGQRGSVLLMVLVFMVLIAIISVVSIEMSVLSRKMVVNINEKENTFHMTEGILNDATIASVKMLEKSLPLVAGDVFCMTNSMDRECTPGKKILTLSSGISDIAKGGLVDYSVWFYKEEKAFMNAQGTTGSKRPAEHEVSEGLLLRYMEIRASYSRTEQGLSKAKLARGIVHYSLLPDSVYAKDVKADENGLGTGRYLSRY